MLSDKQRRRRPENICDFNAKIGGSNSVSEDPPSFAFPNITPEETPFPVNCERPGKHETGRATEKLMNAKTPGPFHIPADVVKADLNTSTGILFQSF